MKFGEVRSHPEWKLLFEEFEKSDYDTFISHQKIEAILGHTRKKSPQKYYGFVNRWKDEMLEKAFRQIECVSDKGYRIVKPEEFRTSAVRQIKLGRKRTKKAARIVMNAPIHLLSDGEKKKIGEVQIYIDQLDFFQKETMKKTKLIEKKPDNVNLDAGKSLDVAD